MNLKTIHNVYFIGIGGIGMSALAIFYKANGLEVSGYDKTSTEITDHLQNLGIFLFILKMIKVPFLMSS